MRRAGVHERKNEMNYNMSEQGLEQLEEVFSECWKRQPGEFWEVMLNTLKRRRHASADDAPWGVVAEFTDLSFASRLDALFLLLLGRTYPHILPDVKDFLTEIYAQLREDFKEKGEWPICQATLAFIFAKDSPADGPQ